MAPQEHVVAYEDGTWVTTDRGPVHLDQGETLPEDVHPDEVARLANAGVLEGIDQAPELVGAKVADELDPAKLPEGDADEIKTRVGSDHETAQAYLEVEEARTRPRKGLVAHLQGVIAAAEENTDPGPPLTDENPEA